jgi:hypothetical protein
MANAHRILGGIALLCGLAGIGLRLTGYPLSESGSTCAVYLFGAVLVLSGIVLIRGAPEALAGKAPVLREPGPEVEDLVRQGEIIPAIKRYRELYGASLKDAKDAVDALREQLRGGRP